MFTLLRALSFFFQAEDGIRDSVASRGLGDVYKRQVVGGSNSKLNIEGTNCGRDEGPSIVATDSPGTTHSGGLSTM